MAFKSTTDKVFFFKNFGRSILFFQKSLTIYETPVKTGSITHEWLTNKGAQARALYAHIKRLSGPETAICFSENLLVATALKRALFV
jgi:hypothetical protein